MEINKGDQFALKNLVAYYLCSEIVLTPRSYQSLKGMFLLDCLRTFHSV
jgi:hypothetical protein